MRCKDYCFYLKGGGGGSSLQILAFFIVLVPPLLIGVFQFFLANLVT